MSGWSGPTGATDPGGPPEGRGAAEKFVRLIWGLGRPGLAPFFYPFGNHPGRDAGLDAGQIPESPRRARTARRLETRGNPSISKG